jgi:beta-mannanase
MWFQPWAPKQPNRFDASLCVAAYEQGLVPMITWEPWDPGKNSNFVVDPESQSKYRLQNIINGSFDPYIRQFARDAKAVRGPIMIRLMHEMNGNWYPWDGTVNGNSPAQFIAAWRHIHDIFKEEGATNVTWVWSVNHESVPATKRNAYRAYYPGDAYVDWTSMSGFNWGTTAPGTHWRTFNYWYHAPLAYLKTLKKPIVLAEFGTVEQGGSKAAWIKDAYKRIRTQHPEVKAVVYYDKREAGPGSTQDWRITTSSKSKLAYRSAVAAPGFVAGPTSTLATWVASLTPENWQYLRQFNPIYQKVPLAIPGM